MGARPEAKLLLLCAPFSEGRKDLIAATLCWMAEEAGFEFDVFYLARSEGGLFSLHGSTVAGGRRLSELWRAMARFETTAVVGGDLGGLRAAVEEGAREVVEWKGVVALYADFLRRFRLDAEEAVAVQTEGLPGGVRWGVAQYFAPVIAERRALGVPLELSREEVEALRSLGVRRLSVVCAEGADLTRWREAGFEVEALEALRADETYSSLSRRLARRLEGWARGIDICEPVLASYWLPQALRGRRLMVCFEELGEGARFAADFAKRKGDFVVHGRYGGGPVGGARSDEDLFPLFERGVSFQVVEPGRPPLTVFLRHPRPLPERRGPFDLEPPDGQLEEWAREGKILATVVFHSGEMSHLDAALSAVDLCASTGVKVGLSVHVQRYLLGGEFVEMLHTPPQEGGVMGLCEPVLHSSGFGILAESMAEPREVASLMAEARRKVAELVGERAAPRGVYCYLDARPQRWEEGAEALWRAVAEAGFSYLVSSVSCGEGKVLFRKGDFVVISQCGHLTYPFSPFARVDGPEEMAECERRLAEEGRPGFILAVLDSPIYACPPYLSSGDPFNRRRLAEFFDYLKGGGVTGKLVNATPHTVARYARLVSGN